MNCRSLFYSGYSDGKEGLWPRNHSTMYMAGWRAIRERFGYLSADDAFQAYLQRRDNRWQDYQKKL